jgi:hypothetical protein
LVFLRHRLRFRYHHLLSGRQAMTRRTASLRSTALTSAILIALLALGAWGVVLGIIGVARSVLIPLAGLLIGGGK